MNNPCPKCCQCANPDSIKVTITPVDGPRYPYEPDYAVPPGRTIIELMADRGWSPGKLADELRWNPSFLADVLIGRQPLDKANCVSLSLVLNTASEYWRQLEANYRTTLARQEREKAKA